MEERAAELSQEAGPSSRPSHSKWRDLREWLTLVEAHGELKRVSAPVDPDEELSAIAFMATRREDAPALLFDNLAGNQSGASVLINMLGASKERYALAVGLDPALSVAEMIAGTRDLMRHRIPPTWIAKSAAPVNEVVLRDDAVDLTTFPSPKSGRATAGATSAPATSR